MMNIVAAFIIGLLVGWIIEWIIDWIFWRRKKSAAQAESLMICRSRVADLEQEIASYKNQLASLQADKLRAESLRTDTLRADVSHAVTAPPVREAARSAEVSAQGMEPASVHEPLETINGVTLQMVQQLHDAGIHTFANLSALRPQELKEILGEQVSQPGSEVEIIKQARLASGMIKKVDDLEIIVGIGPVIARALMNSGIFTFAELASLSARDLRRIVGTRIDRLADVENILSQARQLAEDQKRGG